MTTKTEKYIQLAIDKGYWMMEDGTLVSKKGTHISVKLRGKQRYPTFSINYGEGIFGIPVHQFAAYCYYGKKPKGLVVRHLDGNTCNNSKANIKYGTHSENNLDKPKEVRVRAAKIANASQTRHPSLKLTDDEMKEIAEHYLPFFPKKAPNGLATKLANAYGVNRNTIAQIAKRMLSIVN